MAEPVATAQFRLSIGITVMMATQSLIGLIWREKYRDIGWIRATWFGNDGVTLFLAVPLLTMALLLIRKPSSQQQGLP